MPQGALAQQPPADGGDLLDIIMGPEEGYSSLLEEARSECLAGGRGHTHLFGVTLDGQEVEITAGRLLASAILLLPYREASVRPSPSRVVRGQLSASAIRDHLTATIAELHGRADPASLNLAVAEAVRMLSAVGSAVATRAGTSISLKSLFEACDSNERIWELLQMPLPEASEFHEIEQAIEDNSRELIKLLTEAGGDYSRMILSGAAINTEQFKQAFISVGPKPNLFGQVQPEPIEPSFLVGMRGPEDFYVNAVSARKALVTNYRQVKTSGYLARKLVLLVADHRIQQGLLDCGTIHGVPTVIHGEDHARRLEGRFICIPGGRTEVATQARLLDAAAKGERVTLRSPITCAGPEGVCHVCYGRMAIDNETVHAGILATLRISEQITQRLLSSKHLLKTKSARTAWPEELTRAFVVERTHLLTESEVRRVIITKEDIHTDEEEEGARVTSKFSYILSGANKPITVESPIPLFLEKDVWCEGRVQEEEYTIYVEPVQHEALFSVSVANDELAAFLNAIFALIEKDDHDSVTDLYEKFMWLLSQSGIQSPSIHAEMIIRALVRDPQDLTFRPDYSTGPERPDEAILKLSPAIFNSASITNSLAFERVKNQLTDTDSFRKQSTGLLDQLFQAH